MAVDPVEGEGVAEWARQDELMQARIEERHADWEKQTKFCPNCGYRMLGGVPGDRSLVRCVHCKHVTFKYLREADG